MFDRLADVLVEELEQLIDILVGDNGVVVLRVLRTYLDNNYTVKKRQTLKL